MNISIGMHGPVPLDSLGTSLVVGGALANATFYATFLTRGGELLSPAIAVPWLTILGQVLSLIIIIVGFVLAQIGRRQEHDAEAAQKEEDRLDRLIREKQIADLVEISARAVADQTERIHQDTVAKLAAVHATTTEASVQARAAYSEANNINQKIATLEDILVKTVETGSPTTINRTPNTILTEVPVEEPR